MIPTMDIGGYGPTALSDPTAEYVVGGPWGTTSVNGGFLLAEAFDWIVSQFGSRVYELMQYDSSVASSLFLLKAGALADGLQITPKHTAAPGEIISKRKRKSQIKLAAEIADFGSRCVENLDRPINETLYEMLDSLSHGCMLAELVFTEPAKGQDKGKYVLTRLPVKPRWAWAFRVDRLMQVPFIRAWTIDGWLDVERDKFALMTWNPKVGDPRGSSVLATAYVPWNYRFQTYPDLAEYLKKFASASLVLEAGPDLKDVTTFNSVSGVKTTYTIMDQLLNAGKEFRARSVLALPNGTKANLLQSSGNGEAYHSSLDRWDREIFRSIIIATRPMQEAMHGSKADTVDTNDLFKMAANRVRSSLASMFRRDVMHRVVSLNWGPEIANEYTPNVQFGQSDTVNSGLLTAFSDAWAKGFLDPGHLPYVWSKVGLPMPIEIPDVEDAEDKGSDTEDAADKGADKSNPDDSNGADDKGPSARKTVTARSAVARAARRLAKINTGVAHANSGT